MAVHEHETTSSGSFLSLDGAGHIVSPRDAEGNIIQFHLRAPGLPIAEGLMAPRPAVYEAASEAIDAVPGQIAIDGLDSVVKNN